MHIKTSDQPAFEIGFGDYSCNWGVHMAGLYETDEERDNIILGFLCKGDLAGDLQLYCPVERTIEDFEEKMREHSHKCADHTHNSDHFQISSAKELYYPDGKFSPWAMDEGLNSFYKQSQAHGKRNIRATAEMIWALEAIDGIDGLMAYESRLNYFIPDKPWISICLYNITKFPGSTIMDVLRTHPYTVSKGVITKNPYYVNPDEWLAENAPAFMNDKK